MGATVSSLISSPSFTVLNTGEQHPDGETEPKNAVILMEKLEKLMRRVQGEFLSPDGKTVDYDGLKISPTFAEYSSLAEELQTINLDGLSEFQRKAFFINLYNLITVHALAMIQHREQLSSPSEVKDFWKSYGYSVGGMAFSLDDIEHGILRGNKPHPSRALINRSYFSKSDPRASLSMKECDPRIHFALNCGALSCPRISIYNGKNDVSLDASLQTAAEAFCAENVQLDSQEKKVMLSKIFDWYGADFGDSTTARLIRIAQWLSPEKKLELESLIKIGAKVSFMPYNWNLNKKS